MVNPMTPPIPTPPPGAGGPPPMMAGDPEMGDGGGTPPQEAPMMTPEPAEGQQAVAKTNVRMAMEILENVLPVFGAHTKEGTSILNTLKSLGKTFGESDHSSKEMIPAEIMNLMKALPASTPGAPPPQPLVGGPTAPPMPPQ